MQFLSATTETLGCTYQAVPQTTQDGTIGRADWLLPLFLRFSHTLQQGGHTVHREYANKEKAENSLATTAMLIRPGLGIVVESGSVDISRLSGVKADESHLA